MAYMKFCCRFYVTGIGGFGNTCNNSITRKVSYSIRNVWKNNTMDTQMKHLVAESTIRIYLRKHLCGTFMENIKVKLIISINLNYTGGDKRIYIYEKIYMVWFFTFLLQPEFYQE